MEGCIKLNLVLVITVMVVGAGAKEHIVGGSFGWNPPNSLYFFDTWGIREGLINVNDVFVFNFPTGAYTVAEVTMPAHSSCDGSNPLKMYTNGPARVTLDIPGIHCFICTIGTHCSQNFMNMIVRVEFPPPLNNSSSSVIAVIPSHH